MSKEHKDKKISKSEEEELATVQRAIDKVMVKLCHYHNQQMVASTMMANALKLYKTILNPSDYNEVIETIIRMKDDVGEFKTGTIH